MDKLVIIIVLIFLMFGLGHSATSISPCSQTPYPQLCHSLVVTKPLTTIDQTQFELRESALKVTLNKAHHAHGLIVAMDVSSFNERAKVAWADCLELYEDTIYQLNRSLGSNDPGSTQTWLSAATTNQQTCKNGFMDFNLASYLKPFPVILSDFSKLLSNSLAINKVVAPLMASLSTKKTGGRRLLSDGFPEWMSSADRKLLQTAPKGDVVVAQDGSGDYKTISAAVAAAKGRSGGKRFVIYVKAGVYKENVVISRSMKNLMVIGDGMGSTIVTASKNSQDGATTFGSATFAVSGDGFMARDMTFENTAGPQKHQAVALRSGSDHSVFYSCSIKGYQDSLYVYAQRQFYRDCDIYGTIDFIFGNAVSVLQNCNIYIRKPMSGQWTTVTAQGRTDPNENTGIVIHNSRVTGGSDLSGGVKCYLGRPWQKYSRTVFMKSSLGGLINSAGWLPWSGNFALSTLYYGEYMNTGPGADTSGRVKWPGYHVMTSATEAGKFSVGNFLAGDAWIPSTGVPFTSGL
ncbi:Pectinesterase [Actinidia chinensis var. chinensis]|uniref:Pectinesterase n=1 Tax=Actinidia chinensis var. chinensis TaxID=1590841 RepID=A0A2R6PGQ2_ACTCC|nr:Pectinesterase [Actinidia chinensis var. chinensis]